jgi:hypothetical protein
MLGGCASVPPPAPAFTGDAGAPGSGCRTASAAIAFDFDGASSSACAVTGERSFAILVTPEHAAPINPSPWYAFRYEAAAGAPVSVTLRYLGGKHRYNPKWRRGEAQRAKGRRARARAGVNPGGGVSPSRVTSQRTDAGSSPASVADHDRTTRFR